MDVSISWTVEKTEVSSTNSLAVDERLWLKSFTYIRKKSGPKIDPWHTAASTGDQVDAWSIKRTCWYLPPKKLSISFKGLPEIPVDWMLDSIKSLRDF